MINNKKMINNKIINNNKFNVIKQAILIFAIALFVFLTMTAVSAADLPSFDGNNSTTVRNETTVASTNVSDNDISGIKGALAIANTVYLNSGTFKGANNTNILINKNVTIIGKPKATIDCEKNGFAFSVSSGYSLTLINITIANSSSSSIKNNGNLTVINSQFVYNSASRLGGAIDNNESVSIINSTFENNSATFDGGAIENNANMTIINSIFKNNSASDYGGAIDSWNGILIISNTNFTQNSATSTSSGVGGAIYSRGENLHINTSNFVNNSAGNNGGAIYDKSNKLAVVNSNFVNNSAKGSGSAIYGKDGNITVVNTTFVGVGDLGKMVDCENIVMENSSIIKITTTISLSSNLNSTSVNSVVVFSAVLNSNSGLLSGKTIDFYRNNVKIGYNVTNSNGIAIYNMNFTSVGSYDVFASFAGDSNYNASNSSVKSVSIPKLPTVINLKISKSSIKYGYLVKFTANLTNIGNKALNGQKIYFYLGNKKLGFNTTNSQGIAIFNYYGKTVGKFSIIAKLAENSNYYSNSSNKKTLTLSKDTPKVTFAIAKSRLKIKKKVKISVTLKSSLKKAIKSQKVYLYAVGRSWFTATINSLGKVNFYAKGYAKGTFTVYIKFKGNTYYKSANSNKIKVTLYR